MASSMFMNVWFQLYLIGAAVKMVMMLPSVMCKTDPDRAFFNVLFWPVIAVIEVLLTIGRMFGMQI